MVQPAKSQPGPISRAIRDLIVNLRIEEETNASPALSAGGLDQLRKHLERVLVDTILRQQHTELLKELYRGSFRIPRPRRDLPEGSRDGGSPDTVTITASNTGLRLPQSLLELVLVLDNTGSMADYASSDKTQGTKIQGLRTAATDLVNDILGVQNNNSYVGLVPFTTMVNVNGSLLPGGSWMTPSFTYNPTYVSMAPTPGVTGSGWGGCAVEPRLKASKWRVSAAARSPAQMTSSTKRRCGLV